MKLTYRRFVSAVQLVIYFSLLSITPGATYSGGDGSPSNPFRISSKADLMTMTTAAADYSSHFILTGDIDLTGETFTSAVIAPDTETTAGFQGLHFSGTFDGRGYKIDHLSITGSGSHYLGLFGSITYEGRVENLRVEQVHIVGVTAVGGLAGRNLGTISGCHASGDVQGDEHVGGLIGITDLNSAVTECDAAASVAGISRIGGLVGYSGGALTLCRASGSVEGFYNVGGLVGQNNGSILGGFASGDVAGDSEVGGLVGDNYQGSLTNCGATGSVGLVASGFYYNYIGGLVGYNNGGVLNSCYATGQTIASNVVGGLTGHNAGSLINCYATGGVQGGTYVGGLTGLCNGSVNRCFSAGAVIGSAETGGLIGRNEGTMTDCFWDWQASGRTNGVGSGIPDGVSDQSSAEMMMRSTFAGWDFTGETAAGTNDIWRMCVDGISYPRLNWQSVEGDFVCEDGVSLEDLDYFAAQWLVNSCSVLNSFCGGSDLNYSGTVELSDFALMAQNWMND